MATTSRDDFSIAIRSAFIKKGNKQKFSLLALIIASIILLSLETLNSKPLSIVRTTFKDIIYRISFMASLPSNFTGSVFNTIEGHFKIYQEYDSLKIELEKYKDEQKKISFLKTENDKLKNNRLGDKKAPSCASRRMMSSLVSCGRITLRTQTACEP